MRKSWRFVWKCLKIIYVAFVCNWLGQDWQRRITRCSEEAADKHNISRSIWYLDSLKITKTWLLPNRILTTSVHRLKIQIRQLLAQDLVVWWFFFSLIGAIGSIYCIKHLFHFHGLFLNVNCLDWTSSPTYLIYIYVYSIYIYEY